jgi:YVTN family beta-propeller protein
MSISELPSGTVTFLFTDIEGSTRLIKQLRDRYGEALADHQRILRGTFDEYGGREIDTQGDSFFVAFSRAKDAVAAAVAAQRNLDGHDWLEGVELRVRMGIHTGEPIVGEERYVGLGVHRAARICAAGHGGQILVSQTTRELLRDDPLPDVSLLDLEEHQLKDLDEPERLYQLVAPGLIESFPPLRTAGATPFAGREGELAEAAAEELAKRWRRPGRRVLLAATLAAAAVGAGLGVLLTQGGVSTTLVLKANSVGVIDPDSGKVASQIPVGAAPSGMAVDPGGIWVANTDDQTVSQVDPRTNTVVQTIEVGAGPAGIAIAAGAVWVVNALDGTVSRIDPEKKSVVQTVSDVGNGPTAIAYGLGALWVANGGENSVSKINPQDGMVRDRLAAGPGASGIAVGFGSLWVTSERTASVSRLDPTTKAVVGTINVGNGPVAVVVGAGSVWVANTLDGTVSRIDPHMNSVTATISTGPGPSDIAVGPQAVWVANNAGASLTRIDVATNRVVRTVRLGNRPEGLALARGSVLVAVRELGVAHRGGTLRVYSGRRGLNSIDPGISYESYNVAIPSLTSDGLVAYNHVGGSDGSTLVPDLASSLPLPTDAGKTYTFELRSGIRYSSGRVVRAEDIRRAIERVFRVASPGSGYYAGIVGGARCAKRPKKPCDLSRGIVVDPAARSVTFRLIEPDPDFLYKLASPFASPVPPGIPNRDVGTRPLPATGPYKIARYVRHRELIFVRNPFFREWSQAANPAGYPDRIVWRLDVGAAAATKATEDGRADVAYDFVPSELLDEVATQYASQLHVDPIPGTYFYLLDARRRPFNDVRVRQALNYAVDRNVVSQLAGGAKAAQPTCQVLPANFPGYRPYCPYTANPAASGRWLAPDLDKARRLVAASGTKGERVKVWAADKAEGAYVASLLHRLGYRTQLRTIIPFSKYTAAIQQFFGPRNTVQIAALRWFADYPTAAGFLATGIFNCSYFCDRKIDRQIARAHALQVTDTRAANALWVRIDRELTDQAPWLFLYNKKQADFVSSRVGNFQYNLQYGILLDQLWVK